MKSWKTSVAGIMLVVAAVTTGLSALMDGNPDTTLNLESILAACAGAGLWFARDDNVTSEKAGAKKP